MTLRTVLPWLLLVPTGCWWEPQQAIELAVWSDDDSEQVYVQSRWEREAWIFGVPEGASSRGLRSRVVALAATGGASRELIAEQDDLGVLSVYHMVEQGYTALTLQDSGQLRLVRLAASGERQVIAEHPPLSQLCSWLDAIPSPDGATIAVVQRGQPETVAADPGQPVLAGCQPGTVEVRFIDATTLDLRAGPFTWSVADAVDATWTPAGAFLVVCANQAWRVDRVAGAVQAPAPRCTYPRTTSSDVSEAGVQIGPGDETQPVRVLQTGAATFGCQ